MHCASRCQGSQTGARLVTILNNWATSHPPPGSGLNANREWGDRDVVSAEDLKLARKYERLRHEIRIEVLPICWTGSGAFQAALCSC